MNNNELYVLDPNLALMHIMKHTDDQSKYLVYNSDIEIVKDTISSLGITDRFIQDNIPKDLANIRYLIADSYIRQLLPIVDALRFSSPVVIDKDKYVYHTPVKIISNADYLKLSNIAQQFYIKQSEMNTQVYKTNGRYAELLIPPRGFYTAPILEPINRDINVRGKISKVYANSVRMLLRLRDGALMELYTKSMSQSALDNLLKGLYEKLDKVVYVDPEIAKTYVLSICLDTGQDRPAYSINKIVNLLNI
jgi:hypothetical protein